MKIQLRGRDPFEVRGIGEKLEYLVTRPVDGKLPFQNVFSHTKCNSTEQRKRILFIALQELFRDQRVGRFGLPVDGYHPPALSVVEKLEAVDPAHEWVLIGRVLECMIRREYLRDITVLIGVTG